MVDFICLGGKKCGTTWLYNQLSANKNLNPSTIKEPNFFGSKKDNIEWYDSLWDKKKEGLKFECTASYIYNEETIKSILKRYPECKFILLLREQFERSISHFQLINRNNKIKNYEEFLENNFKKIVSWSLIFPQLKTLNNLNLLDRTLIINFDKIKTDPVGAINDVSKFLNVELSFYSDIDKGEGYISRSKFIDNIKYKTSEFIIKNFSISPKKLWIFRALDYLYKTLLTEKLEVNDEIKILLNRKYGQLFTEDKKLLLEEFNIKIYNIFY